MAVPGAWMSWRWPIRRNVTVAMTSWWSGGTPLAGLTMTSNFFGPDA
jgi:hypothetical protein